MFLEKATANLIKETYKDIQNLKKGKNFLIEDIKTLEVAIERELKFIRLLITENFLKNGKFLFENYPFLKEKTYLINSKELKKLKQLKTNGGIIALFRFRREIKPSKNSIPFHFFLDRVQDPGNVGTIIRSALNFDIRKLYLSEGSASIYNPKVVRGSMGAVFSLPIEEKTDLKKIFKRMREEGKNIFFTSSKVGKKLNSVKIPPGSAIVFGNESSGISENLEEFATGWLKIPSSGKTESLSVSTSASIMMYELFTRFFKGE